MAGQGGADRKRERTIVSFQTEEKEWMAKPLGGRDSQAGCPDVHSTGRQGASTLQTWPHLASSSVPGRSCLHSKHNPRLFLSP